MAKSELKIPDESKGWLAAVGLMGIYWADAEALMDAYINVMRHHPDAITVDDLEVPAPSLRIAFKKRIRLWKDTIVKLPFAEKKIKVSLRLAERMRIARNHRDILLHGATYADNIGRHFALHRDQEQHIPYPESKVLKIADEIWHIRYDLLTHIGDVTQDILGPSREKLTALIQARDSRRSLAKSGKR